MKLSDTGLRIQPFQTHGKPLVVVPYDSQKAAIRFLARVRSDDHGLGLFLGPPLSGKTSVIEQYRKSLSDHHSVAVIDGAGKNPAILFQEILEQFGYDQGFSTTNERFSMIRVFAMQQTATSEAPLLIIENAQAMSPIVLELLCDLAELRVSGKSALRIVLASSKPLTPIIEAPAMQPISKRVTGRFLLQPLTQAETTYYVYKKLKSGGCTNPQYLVSREVCDRVHSASGGWPGMIDRVAMMTIANARSLPLRVEHVPGQPASVSETGERRALAPHLILTHRHRTLGKVALDGSRILIGRNEVCDLRIDGEWISRHHAVLFCKDRTTIIVDLDSKNGTLVNGKRVSRQVLINDDIIMLEDHRLKFVDPSARRRTTLEGAGWDDTTIVESVNDVRNNLATQVANLNL